jgi:hypothetical protein
VCWLLEHESVTLFEQPCPEAIYDTLRAARCGFTVTIDPVEFQQQFNAGWQQNTIDYTVVLPWQVASSSVLTIFQNNSSNR